MTETIPDGWQQVDKNKSRSYKQAAYMWLAKNGRAFRRGTRRAVYYHPDDLKAFDEQYKVRDVPSIEQWREAIDKHAPNTRAIMIEMGYGGRSTSNFKQYYIPYYPELEDIYNKACLRNEKKKQQKEKELIEAVKHSVEKATFEEALASTGLRKLKYQAMFLEHVGQSAANYFQLKYRLNVLKRHATTKGAAKELGMTGGGLCSYIKYNTGKTPQELKREWETDE